MKGLRGLQFILVVALAMAALIARAEPYVAAGYVSSQLNPDSGLPPGFDSQAVGFTARFGWQFNDYFTMEADYTDYGESRNGSNDEYLYSGQGGGLFATLGNARLIRLFTTTTGQSSYRTVDLGVYTRVGLVAVKSKATIGEGYENLSGGEGSYSADDNDIGYGLGAGILVSYYPVGFFLEYNTVRVPVDYGRGSTYFEPDYWVAGLQFTF